MHLIDLYGSLRPKLIVMLEQNGMKTEAADYRDKNLRSSLETQDWKSSLVVT